MEVEEEQINKVTMSQTLDDEQMNEDQEEITPSGKEENAIVVRENGELDGVERIPSGDGRTPQEGMVFKSYEEVLNFFKRYALRAGFGVCVKKSSFTKAGLCRRLVLVCNKWGSGKEDACYQSRPTAKTNCQATVVARLWSDGLLHLTDINLDHNHALNPSSARFLRCYKTLPSGMSKDLVVRAARGEYSSPDMEASVFDEWGRLKIGEGDVEAISHFFAEMQAKQPNFFYVIDFYMEGNLRSIFWADCRARAAYQYFNDAVWVDTTCLRNKFDVPLVLFVGVNNHGQLILLGCGLLSDESIESFLWLLKSWLTCMKGHPPNALVTDEGKALKAAVREVFPKVRHRICLWQVMRSISEKLGELGEYETIKTELDKVVYDSLKDDEFEERWKNLTQKFGLEENELLGFLYEDRHLWVPAFLKDTFWAGLSTVQHQESLTTFFKDFVSPQTTLTSFLSNYMMLLQSKYEMEVQADFESLNRSRVLVSKLQMEEHLSKLYTAEIFRNFQDELKATVHCQVRLGKVDGSTNIFIVEEYTLHEVGGDMGSKNYEVLYCVDDHKTDCICGLFQFTGVLCRHALSVLKLQQLYEIPSPYVLNRWRNDCKQLHALDNPLKDIATNNLIERYDYMSRQCLRLVDIGVTSDEKSEFALKLLIEIRKTLLDDNLCRELEKKLSPSERAIANGDSHGQPGISEGGPPKKRRGRPPKKNKELSLETVLTPSVNKDSMMATSDGSQKDAFHSSSIASNLGTHVRTHGVVDLMEEVTPNDFSFDSHYGLQPNQQQHFDDQLPPGSALQFGQPGVDSNPRMQQWLYQQILQDGSVPPSIPPPFGQRTT